MRSRLACLLMCAAAHASELPRPPVPAASPDDRPLPVTLPAALQLANARPLDIAVAAARVDAATAALDRAKLAWLPNLYVGVDYQRHDGQIQDVAGTVFTTSRSSVMVGAGPVLVLPLAEALYGPLAARQLLDAARAGVQVAANDSLLAVAESYFAVQQARGELAGAADVHGRAADLAARVEKLAAGLAPKLEATRARADLARREQAAAAARERWQVAGTELNRLLRLDPTTLVEPQEPPHLLVTLFDSAKTVDELIPIGLASRPELAANQALVQATLARLKQEKCRPLIPSVILRPATTSPSNLLAGGYFGGGINNDLRNFGGRSDFDLQVVWELQNLGLGNKAAVRQREAENRQALLELFRVQDRVAAEVARAHAQLRGAAARLKSAEDGVREAVELANQNRDALGQTRRVGELLVLIVRPQEAVASIQALAAAYPDYYAAVADYNRAQFRLYRALGQPAHCVAPVAAGPPAVQSPQALPAPADAKAP